MSMASVQSSDTFSYKATGYFTPEFIARVFRPTRFELRGNSMDESKERKSTVSVKDRNGVVLYNGMDYHGCMVPVYTENHDTDLAAMETMEPSPKGVIICSYPRSGNQWLFDTIKHIKSGLPEPVLDPIFEFSFIENAGNIRPSNICPDLVYTHFTPNRIPPQILNAYKVVNILRNPKDVAVSFYNLTQDFLLFNYSGSWETFLEMYMDGRVPYGSWIDHTREWEEYSATHDVLNINYENMIDNYSYEVMRISRFIGMPVDLDFCEKLKVNCSFEKMKEIKRKSLPEFMKKMFKDDCVNLLRKGQKGMWKHWFTVAQNEQYNERLQGSSAITRLPTDVC